MWIINLPLTFEIIILERCHKSKSCSPMREICYKSGFKKIKQFLMSQKYFKNEVCFGTQPNICPYFPPFEMDTFGKMASTPNVCCFPSLNH